MVYNQRYTMQWVDGLGVESELPIVTLSSREKYLTRYLPGQIEVYL